MGCPELTIRDFFKLQKDCSASTAYYTSGTGKKGKVYTQTNANSNTTTFDYSASTGRKIKVTNALSKDTEYTYNTRGQVVLVTGNATDDYCFNAQQGAWALVFFMKAYKFYNTDFDEICDMLQCGEQAVMLLWTPAYMIIWKDETCTCHPDFALTADDWENGIYYMPTDDSPPGTQHA